MIRGQSSLIRDLGGWLRHRSIAHGPDAELVRRVAGSRDEDAFNALAVRHGPMVWGVCEHTADNVQIAEDAFQATFLQLIQRASTIRRPAALAAWLHGTAYRLTIQACRQARKRQTMIPRKNARAVDPLDEVSSRELFAILDRELNRLHDFYREPLVLCYYEGLTQDEAARRLGVSPGSIKGRLERGRAKLADRLKRCGIKEPAILLAPIAAIAVPADVSAKAMQLIQPVTVWAPAVARLATAGSSRFSLRAGALFIVITMAAIAGFRVVMSETKEPDSPPTDQKASAIVSTENERLPTGAIARLGTTRLRPGGGIGFLSFSPDGKRLASWSHFSNDPGHGSIFEVATGRELIRTTLPGVQAASFAWLADGRGAACMWLSWRADGSTILWNFAASGPLPPTGVHDGPAFTTRTTHDPDSEHDSCVAVSPDGKFIAVGRSGTTERERAIEFREFELGKDVRELKTIRRIGNHPDNCGDLRFTPDGKTLVSFSGHSYGLGDLAPEMQAVIWDVASGKERRRLKMSALKVVGPYASVALSNQYLALGLEDETATLQVYDLVSGKERRIATGHKSTNGWGYGVDAIAITPDGQTVVTGGPDPFLRLWDLPSGQLKQTCNVQPYLTQSLSISPDAKTIARGGDDGVIRLFDMKTGADTCPQPGHSASLSGMTVSFAGNTAVTTGSDGTLRVWNLTDGHEERVINVNGRGLKPAISPDGARVLAGFWDRPMRMWETATGKEMKLPGACADAKTLGGEFFGDKALFTVRVNGVDLWDWPTGKPRESFELSPPDKKPGTTLCNSAFVSPDGKLLVTFSHRSMVRVERDLRLGSADDGVVDLWDVTTGRRIRRLIESASPSGTAVFTPDGKLIVLGWGKKVHLDGRIAERLPQAINEIDPATSELLRTFDAPPAIPGVRHPYIGAMVISPDGRSLFAGDNTGRIIVYDRASGHVRHTFIAHRALINGIVVTNDGKKLVTASMDSTAMVWDLTSKAINP